MSKRIYIQLWVYNYDRSPRVHSLQHECKSVEKAKHLVKRLQTLMGIYVGGGRTGNWLQRKYGIFGFIETIEGIFEETIRRIA